MHGTRLAELFEDQRPHLRRVAYRMLGTWVDADDAVQETWLRLQRAGAEDIDNLAGWLTTAISRLCLDRLRSRRARPETLIADPPAWPDAVDDQAADDPAADAELADAVGRALAVVLDTLSPTERVAFVLHDVFAVPFAEVATVLGRSTEATKKLTARARRRAQLGSAEHPDGTERHRRIIQAFLDAIRAGDIAAVVALLAPDATRYVDPALLPAGRPHTVRGAHVIAHEARTFSGPAHDARLATIDGRPGAAVMRDGRPALALTFRIAGGRIQAFEVTASPEKLGAMSILVDG